MRYSLDTDGWTDSQSKSYIIIYFYISIPQNLCIEVNTFFQLYVVCGSDSSYLLETQVKHVPFINTPKSPICLSALLTWLNNLFSVVDKLGNFKRTRTKLPFFK